MLTVPKSKLFLSFFFFFFGFVVFFCLHVQLFLLGFVICCNGNLIYFLDGWSSGDWSLAQGDYTERWAIFYIQKKSKQVTEVIEGIDFPGILKKEHMENLMEFPWVLVFDLGISLNKGCHTILQNLHGWKLVL